MTTRFFLLLFCFILFSCQPKEENMTHYDVVVLGEGTGAVAAAIQSARSGATTLLVNSLPWLGGMLTSAGVSAIDGNHNLPAGLWGEFRDSLRAHYGGAEALATGWVSNTQFEPSVGAAILERIASNISNLTIHYNSTWRSIEADNNWKILIAKEDQSTITAAATILIDGTDLGDVAAQVGCDYEIGMDARTETGESIAPETANDLLQDMTYAAILKDYGEGIDKIIPQPAGYDASAFHCSCQTNCDDPKAHPCETMLTYGKLPNKKYMLNWPIHGNDYYKNVVAMSLEERASVYEAAKLKTLQYVYYIQNELGYKHLGLADDEFPTADRLALMPYHREGRRLKGQQLMKLQHILNPYESELFKMGIAVGDYPVDHHHYEKEVPEIDFPPVPSFNVPMGCLIPKEVDHLLVADKAISVTNIVNGSTRLQPVILQIGQAAGLIAAMAVQQGKSPKDLNVRLVQQALLDHGGYLMPFIDVKPEQPHFQAVQRIGATGILKGKGVPYKWANQTWFYPDTTVTVVELVEALQAFEDEWSYQNDFDDEAVLTVQTATDIINSIAEKSGKSTIEEIQANWETEFQLENFDLQRPITKLELAVLLDKTLNPFMQESFSVGK